MRLWAYGVSPHGLGIDSPEELGLLSPREFCALSDIQQSASVRWAISEATFCNVHLAKDAEPFTADDFLGIGNREERARKRTAEKMRSTLLCASMARHIQSAANAPDAAITDEWLPDYFPRGARNGR